MNNLKYNRYIELRRLISGVKFSGFSLDYISAYSIAELVYFYLDLSFSKKLVWIVKYLFLCVKLKPCEESVSALFVTSTERAEYKELSDAYLSLFSTDFKKIILRDKKLDYRFRISIKSWLFSLKVLRGIDRSGSIEKFFIFLSVYRSVAFLLYLEKIYKNSNLNCFVAFNGSFRYEALMTLFFRAKGVPTYSLQHGMYYEYRNQIPFEMIGVYYNAAEYLLAWGQFTVDQINNYLMPNTKMTVVGNPVYRPSQMRVLNSEKHGGRILVCLPRLVYAEYSMQLLRILSDCHFDKLNFTIRLHPSLNAKLFDLFVGRSKNMQVSRTSTFRQEMDLGYDFVIGFNSTVLFESLLYSIPVIQFRSGDDEFYGVGFSEFSNESELIDLLYGSTANFNVDVNYYFSDGFDNEIKFH